MALETLDFRRPGLSPGYVLLVPTFSLLNAPHWLTPYASQQFRMLLYQSRRKLCFQISFLRKNAAAFFLRNALNTELKPKFPSGVRSFGTILSPGTFSARKLLTSELLRYL